MKTLGKLVCWVLGTALVAVTGVMLVASCQDKTVHELFQKQEVQEEVKDETTDQENTDQTVDPETVANITYNAQSNTICLG